jgi:hypothetical protein
MKRKPGNSSGAKMAKRFEKTMAGELMAAQERIRQLEAALRKCSIDCGDLDHTKAEYHKSGQPCPVVAHINSLLTASETKGEV